MNIQAQIPAVGQTLSMDFKDHAHKSFAHDLMTTYSDNVHPLPDESAGCVFTVDDFENNRVGGPQSTKQCWVRFRADNYDAIESVIALPGSQNAITVDSTLYTFAQTAPVRDERDLCGDVNFILTASKEDLIGKPSAIIFYSVCGFEGSTRGAGGAIINDVYKQHIGQGIHLSTLSPLRGFSAWLKNEEGMGSRQRAVLSHDQDALKLYALKHILTNPPTAKNVQSFHTKAMGAYIGDVNLNANALQSIDHKDGMNIMVNYVYGTPEQREFNKQAAKAGKLVFAPHLYDDLVQLGNLAFVEFPNEKPSKPFIVKPAMF